jgi:ArsR family transcriptional regulator
MPISDDRARAIAANRFRALGDETRLRILETLVAGECSVSELTAGVDVGQSLMSHHLRILREAGLVTDRRSGRWIHYAIVEPALAAVKLTLYELEPLRNSANRNRSVE